MSHRLRIGLTGGIASGKSTVARRFLALGVPVVDADESARRVVAPGTIGLNAVIETFGSHILTDGGELDRRALRNLIFADPKRRLMLESLLHPLIRADMDELAQRAVGPYVVLAIPLLIEGSRVDRVDRILVVDVPESTQLQRVMARDGAQLEQAQAILAAQGSRNDRLKAADDVLLNTGTTAELDSAVDRLHQTYLRLAADTLGEF
jgi:dephospho-CoA kinase